VVIERIRAVVSSMIFCVAYLAIAALSSTRLASAQPDLSETLAELEELRHELSRCGRSSARTSTQTQEGPNNGFHADADGAPRP
jgi:hypothetical protein